MTHSKGPRGPEEAPAKLGRTFRHATGYPVVRGLARVASVLPRPLAHGVFSGFGLLAWAALGRDRRRVAEQVGRALPRLAASERSGFARRFFLDAARNLADTMRFLGRPARELVHLVDVEGAEHLESALARGRGAIGVTGHIGAWELLGGYLVQRGIPVTVIARPFKNARFEAMIVALRSRLGVAVVHETSDLRPAFRALRRGEVLGVLIDQGRRWPGVGVPFFGRPAHVTTAAAEIARRTGAALVPMAIQRQGWRQRVTILPAVDVDWTQPGAVPAATATLARALESIIWRSPTQWAWTYATWRMPAAGSAAGGGGVGRLGDGHGRSGARGSEAGSAEPGGDMMGGTNAAELAERAGARAAPHSRMALVTSPAAALLLAAAFVAGGLGCSEERPAPPARTAPVGEVLPNQEITEFVLRETDEEGRLTWIFRATEARIFEARDDVEARGIHIDFYDGSGRVASVLSADRAVIQRRTNDMHAMGNVVVRNADGQELHTEELQYSSERNKIFTDKFVRVIRGRDLLTGYGLETDPDLEGGQLEIQRDFRATVRDEAMPDLGVGGSGAGGGAAGSGAGGDAAGSAGDDAAGSAGDGAGGGGQDGTP